MKSFVSNKSFTRVFFLCHSFRLSADQLAALCQQLLKLENFTFNLAPGWPKAFANIYWGFASCAAAYCLAYPFFK